MKSGDIAIVGIGESEQGSVPGRSVLQLQSDAIHAALGDAGLSVRDVDGVFCTGLPRYPSLLVAEYNGIAPIVYSDSTEAGGASFEFFVEHACAALAAGLCRTALIVYGSTQRSSRSRRLSGVVPDTTPQAQFEIPYAPLLPISAYAMAAQRHMFEFGTTPEQLAEIAVSTRRWAALNPGAFLRDPIGIEDVLQSPMISSPIHRLEVCLVTDGAGAIVLTTLERARSLRQRPIAVLGHAEAHSHFTISQMADLTRTAAAVSGHRAFEMAGVGPADIDVAEIYDSFTITVLLSLEDLGFCEKGEGGAFVGGGRTAPGGPLPLNTSGGGLAYTHPGMLGIFLLIEAVRQLRGGLGPRQVAGAELAIAHGVGGVLSSHGTTILGRY